MSDVIPKLLHMMRVKGSAFIGKTLERPWDMRIDEQAGIVRFHLVLTGSTWIEIPDTDDRELLTAGDFVLVPYGNAHVLSDKSGLASITHHAIPDTNLKPDFQAFDMERPGTSLLCGYFQFDESALPSIAMKLPNLLISRCEEGRQKKEMELAVQLLELELSNKVDQAPAVLDRMTEILCLYTMRSWIKREASSLGSLAALADPSLQNVIQAVHEDPTAAWTVEELAKIYGKSRTAFAKQFKATIGITPIEYILRWKIECARRLLIESDLTLDTVAHRVGYADTNAFSRAFRRITGSPPGIYRNTNRK